MSDPFRYFKTSPEIIRLAVMMYVRFPLSLRNVEDLLHERGIDICHETVRLWWNRFGPLFAAEIRKRRVYHHAYSLWRCTSTRSSCGSMAKSTISGAPSITKARFSKFSSPNSGTARRL